MADVYVAAGSNVRPEHYLKQALTLLDREFAPIRISPVYRNRAVGFEGDDFLNLVVSFTTDLDVREVRSRLQAIETQCDRPREAPKWAARTMDLDILIYDALVSDEPGLVLPRPDLVRRAYMLKPMMDLAPDLMHPTLGKTMREIWEASELHSHALAAVEL
ncbi:MAG TPA: 2-amino-4-hydroxy-6-hydroxymethyldihydropteridine diphosphokinase [Steroidobacteraceae bacterium]|nr:2-amino-4-hydroxy-6-hydroxymethyldihydropteridine diphosphokinase [Steroidobacteraceae bacterium]